MIHKPTRHKNGKHEGLAVHAGYVEREVNGELLRRLSTSASFYDAKAGVWLPSYGRSHEPQATSRVREGSPHSGYTHHAPDGSLQFHCRDSSDAGNRSLIRLDFPHKPGAFVSWKAIDCSDSDWTPHEDGGGGTFYDLWDGTDWIWRVGAHVVKDVIRLDPTVSPSHFDFTLRCGGGVHYNPTADGIEFIETSTGETLARVCGLTAFDANGSETDSNVRVGFEYPARGVVRIQINPEDFSNASGLIEIDPITVIDGSAVEDNFMTGPSLAATNNRGANANILAGYFNSQSTIYRGILRIASGYPTDPISDIKFFAYQWSSLYSGSGSDYTDLYEVAPANAAWVVGTATNAAQAGSSCYRDLAYHATTPTLWAGGSGSGCGVVGTDILSEAGGQPSAQIRGTSGYSEWSIPVDWDLTGAGFVMRGQVEAASKSFTYYRGSIQTDDPYFEVTHAPASSATRPRRGIGRGMARGIGRGI